MRYAPGLPDEVRTAIEPLLQQWEDLLPTWCQERDVRYDPHDGHRMAATINHRNRGATLVVTGAWFGDTPDEREVSLLHELLHVALEPLSQAVERVLQTIPEDSPLRYHAGASIEDATECVVEDLARGIRRVVQRHRSTS